MCANLCTFQMNSTKHCLLPIVVSAVTSPATADAPQGFLEPRSLPVLGVAFCSLLFSLLSVAPLAAEGLF